MALFRRWIETGLAAALVAGIAAAGHAQDAAAPKKLTGVEIVGIRQEAMRKMQVPRGVFLSQTAASSPDWPLFLAQAKIADEAMRIAAVNFPAGTSKTDDVGGADVNARNEVWTNTAEFKAIFDKGIAATTALVAAGEARNLNAAKAAATAYRDACSACHARFRE